MKMRSYAHTQSNNPLLCYYLDLLHLLPLLQTSFSFHAHQFFLLKPRACPMPRLHAHAVGVRLLSPPSSGSILTDSHVDTTGSSDVSCDECDIVH